MDQIYEFTNQNDDIEFLVSLDNNVSDPTLYSCQEWADLYKDLGEHGNDPVIINGDTDFNEDGSPKDFGVSNEQNKTIFPFWIFCILIGIVSYYIVLFIALLKNKKC